MIPLITWIINHRIALNVESYHCLIDNKDEDLFDTPIYNGDSGHFNNTFNDGDIVHDKGLIGDMEDLPHVHNEHEPCQSRHVIQGPILWG